MYVLANAQLGGAEKITLLMMQHHSAAYEPLALYLNDGPLIQVTRDAGIETHALDRALRLSRPWQVVAATHRLGTLIRTERVDIVHSCMTYPHILAAPAARLSGIPAVMFAHGPVGGNFDRMASLLPTAMVIANSRYTAQKFAAVTLRRLVVETVHLATALHYDDRQAQLDRIAIEREYGLSAQHIVIGLMSRLDPNKGVLFAVASLAPLLRKHAHLRVMIVGGTFGKFHTEHEAMIKRLVKDEGIEQAVIFTGFKQDVRAQLARFDIFLNPSFDEGFGLSVIEAMTYGKPVFASRVGGIPEIIEHETNGLLFKVGDHRDLSECAQRLIDGEALRSTLGTAGSRTVEERFRPPLMMARLEALYDRI